MSKNDEKKGILSGFQDFLPEKMMAREEIIKKIKSTYELFGFLPQDTPVLEYADLLLGKYGDNDKLVYQFYDKGNRHVAMRYDLTVSLSRVVRMYSDDIHFPYRRYQVGMVWRADKPGKGRYREFMQIDADTVGDGSMLSDIETILLALQLMKCLSIDATVRINNRHILDSLADICQISENSRHSLFRIIDKYDKIGIDGVIKELKGISFSDVVINTIEKYLSIGGTNEEILKALQELLGNAANFQSGYDCLREIVNAINDVDDLSTSYRIDPTIARGLDYYTGLIFETTFNPDPEYGSICSGGRYDRLIEGADGKFLPAIGISIGLDRLFAAMESANLTSQSKTITQIFIINFGNQYMSEYLKLAREFRNNGISVEISSDASKLKKQLRYADVKGIPNVILMGPDELSKGKMVVKNMADGSQEIIERKDILCKFNI